MLTRERGSYRFACMPLGWGFVLLAVIGTTSCLSQGERAQIDAWLSCEECITELDSVVTLQNRAVSVLAVALAGPPLSELANLRAQFAATYADVVAQAAARGRPVTSSRAEFVNRYVENYRRTYQVRAITALGQIGTNRALDALRLLQQQNAIGFIVLDSIAVTALQAALTP
jgi:hypothetical protein